MERDEIALMIFCTMLRDGKAISLYPLGEQQIKVAFALARTFEIVAKEDAGHENTRESLI